MAHHVWEGNRRPAAAAGKPAARRKDIHIVGQLKGECLLHEL